MYRGAKRRAKRRRLRFTITTDDIQIPKLCPVLGIPLRKNRGGKAQGDYSPTLDRVVPAKGYVKGNVIVISAMANRIKGNATVEQLFKVATYFKFLLDERNN